MVFLTAIQKIFSVICAAAAVLSAVCLSVTGSPDTAVKKYDDLGISADNVSYIVKNCGGKITVYEENSSTALFMLDSPLVKDLPQYDRDLLASGITVDSSDKLIQLLEDYDS